MVQSPFRHKLRLCMSCTPVATGAAFGLVASVLLRALLDLAYPSESGQPSFIQSGLDCICDSFANLSS